MRRAVAFFAVASALLVSSAALAEDPPPPPPPPPPSSESGGTSDAPTASTFRSADALLDASTGKRRPMMLSFFLSIPYGTYYYYGCYASYCGGFGLLAGARFNIPLVHDGFIPQINDSLDLEFGVDVGIMFGYFSSGAPIMFLPVVEPRYTVYLLPKLAVYVKPLNLGVTIWPGYYQAVWFHYSAALGVIYQISDKIYLRGEIGNYRISGGLGIAL